MNQELIDQVIEQLVKDFADGDWTALAELLKYCPETTLINYLPEAA